MAEKTLSANQQKINYFKGIVADETIQARAKELMGKEAGTFLASCLDLYTSSEQLLRCDPNAVMAQCMKAAALKLPVSASLGLAYIVPYGTTPTFMLGYRGLIQLAQRTGQYKYINADVVFKGETVVNNRITGMVEISGEPESDEVIGYFAYFQLLNGFEKCIYWDKARVTCHAKKYSKAFNNGPWKDNFDAMALKTVIRQIISKYGVMSVEFVDAISMDNEDSVENEVSQNANQEPLMISPTGDAIIIDPVPRGNENKPEDPLKVEQSEMVLDNPPF